MRKILIAGLAMLVLSCGQKGKAPAYSDALTEDAVKSAVEDAILWQLDNMPECGRF